MTRISILTVNIALRSRPVLASAEGEVNLTPVEIAEALCGMVECHRRSDGTRYWFGRKNVWGFHTVEAPELKDFFEVNALERLATAMVPMDKAGGYNSKTRQIMYYVEYTNR